MLLGLRWLHLLPVQYNLEGRMSHLPRWTLQPCPGQLIGSSNALIFSFICLVWIQTQYLGFLLPACLSQEVDRQLEDLFVLVTPCVDAS